MGRILPKHRCTMCGEPINRPGMHYRCRTGKQRSTVTALQSALDKIMWESRARMQKEVKHFHKGQGRKKLLQMFPDMESRLVPGSGLKVRETKSKA